MQSIRCSDPDDAARQAAERFSELMNSAHKDTLILLSGGSSLTLLPYIELPADCSRLTVSMLDQRFSRDERINSFAKLKASSLYEKLQTKGASFIDSYPREADTLESFAQRIADDFASWIATHPQGTIVSTIGVGPDGHIAGIMPFPEDAALFEEMFDDESVQIAGYDAAGKNPYPLRETVTLPFIRHISHAVVYACGEARREALRAVGAAEGSLAQTPARILRELPDVRIFTDIEV